jgi:hypothetical protein
MLVYCSYSCRNTLYLVWCGAEEVSVRRPVAVGTLYGRDGAPASALCPRRRHGRLTARVEKSGAILVAWGTNPKNDTVRHFERFMMTTPAQRVLAARPHRNQQLFSDYYLDTILPGRTDWHMAEEQAASAMARVAAIRAAFTPSTKEAQTENDLIRPVLEAMGHTFEVQPSLRVPGGTNAPDYVLYTDAVAVAQNKGRILSDKTRTCSRPLQSATPSTGTVRSTAR